MSVGRGGGTSHNVPLGFHPETAAAVGARDIWVLGDYRCKSTWCFALVRSTDSGRHFRRVSFPPFPAQGTDATIVFANPLDGFSYVQGETPLYVTRDGGQSWQPAAAAGDARAFAVGGGNGYVVTTKHRLERSPISRDAWVALASVGPRVSIAARGSDVWLLGGPRRKPDSDTVRRSIDRGRTFTSVRGPCFYELGGTLAPAGRGVVWAVCPTGMLAGLWLSTDGGRSFPVTRSLRDRGGLHEPPMTNGASIIPISRRAAILVAGPRGLYRTSDAGRRWTRLRERPRFDDVWWLDLAESGSGIALASTQARSARTLLWRTEDGGLTWSNVPISG